MKSEWKAMTNNVCGEKFYQVFRIIDVTEVVHSGNIEIADTGFIATYEEAKAIAEALNKASKE